MSIKNSFSFIFLYCVYITFEGTETMGNQLSSFGFTEDDYWILIFLEYGGHRVFP